MKIFEDREYKVNFVDVNNVLVGYDLSQSCCEYAGWYIMNRQTEDLPSLKVSCEWCQHYKDGIRSCKSKLLGAIGVVERCTEYSHYGCQYNIEDYIFDTEYFEEFEGKDTMSYSVWYAVFRLKAPGKRDLYLHLFNSHNGYYTHGFNVEVGGENIIIGSL